MKIPSQFSQSIPYASVLRTVGKTKKIDMYLVGGVLRDHLLGLRDHCDFDFAVSRDAVKAARLFARKIKGAFVLLDAGHGCARVVKKKNNRMHTFDFADFRAPTLKQDLAHRDFTVNTLCVDVKRLASGVALDDVLIDIRGARQDLKAKKIRMVAARSFIEDPLRLVRAFSLKATLDFSIDAKTLTEIKKKSNLLATVAYERIRDELFKILATPRTAATLHAMDRAGLLDNIIPQVTVMYKVVQGGYHHLDVWRHSLETVALMENILQQYPADTDIGRYCNEPLAANRTRAALMKLAALLHDIGKPDTRKVEKKRTSFHGHERIGRGMVRTIARMLTLSTRERHALEDMVYWHLRPGYLSNFAIPSPRAVFRYLRDTKDEALSILLLSLADQRATRGPLTSARDQKHHEKIIKHVIKCYYDTQNQKPPVRLVTGTDLIKKLKLRPSALFTVILREVEEQQATGKIKTKKDALALAKKIARKKR